MFLHTHLEGRYEPGGGEDVEGALVEDVEDNVESIPRRDQAHKGGRWVGPKGVCEVRIPNAFRHSSGVERRTLDAPSSCSGISFACCPMQPFAEPGVPDGGENARVARTPNTCGTKGSSRAGDSDYQPRM